MSCSRVGATLLTLGGGKTRFFESVVPIETVAALAESVVADAFGTDLTAFDPAQANGQATTHQTLLRALKRIKQTL